MEITPNNIDAILEELTKQRAILGDRAVELSGHLADANTQIKILTEHIAELENKTEEPLSRK